MDGIQPLSQLLLIGATNRLDLLDPALLRPGRFDELLSVPLPDGAGRAQVLRIHTRDMPLAADVPLDELAAQCADWSGAQLSALCREAAMEALRADIESSRVSWEHFQSARARVHVTS